MGSWTVEEIRQGSQSYQICLLMHSHFDYSSSSSFLTTVFCGYLVSCLYISPVFLYSFYQLYSHRKQLKIYTFFMVTIRHTKHIYIYLLMYGVVFLWLKETPVFVWFSSCVLLCLHGRKTVQVPKNKNQQNSSYMLSRSAII